ADERGAIGLWCGRDRFGREPRADEPVDRMLDAFDLRWFNLLRWNESPVRFVLGALHYPAAQRLALSRSKTQPRVHGRHAQAFVLACHARPQFTLLKIARHDGRSARIERRGARRADIEPQ